MRRNLKPYPSYKASGVPELGEIPTHWVVSSLAHIGQFFKGKGASKEDEVPAGVPCVRYGDLYTQHEFFIRRTRGFISPKRASAYTPIVFGDILFAGSGETIEDIGRSGVNLMETRACCGGDVIGLRPHGGAVVKFLGYACDSPSAKEQKARMGRGFTIVHIYPDELKRLSLALPPVADQIAIVRYLDHMDRRIRQSIRAKQQLIALLNEQKQAIIHRAVTRGLDPNVRLKPSGVEWLGDIPEQWDVKRNGELFIQRNHVGFGALPILEVSLRTGVRVRDFDAVERKQVISDRDKYKKAAKGDLAYNMMRMWQGACGVASTDGLVSPAYVVAQPLQGTDARYFSYLFRSFSYMQEVDKYSRGIVKDRNRLYWDDFKQMPSACPPIGEQAAIANAIEGRTRAADALIAKASREVSLFREYRTGLMSSVLTGKLDVRWATAKFPNEVEAVEEVTAAPLDEETEDLELDAEPVEVEA